MHSADEKYLTRTIIKEQFKNKIFDGPHALKSTDTTNYAALHKGWHRIR